MEILCDWQKDRENVELKTRNQSTNEQWQYIRTKLLTASKFGEICKMRLQTSCVSKVRAILYPQDLPLEAFQYGLENEDKARYQIEEANGLKINKCGLFIHPEISYLVASPDGTIAEDGIIEIKCPFAAKNMTPEDAIKNNCVSIAIAVHHEG